MGTSFAPIGQNPPSNSKLLDSQPDFQVYESPSGEQYERYEVIHDGSQHFQQQYRFRIDRPHADMVQLIFAAPSAALLSCTHRPKLEVITERIPYRLETLSGLHPSNSLAILRTALRGFRDVYRRHGAVGVADSMIGINSRNRVKVWLNRNFAINTPEPPPASALSLPPQEQERQMVLGIFDLVDAKTDHDGLWVELMRMKEGKNPTSFDEGLNLIDYFSGMHRINVSDTVSNLFNKRAYQPSTAEGIQGGTVQRTPQMQQVVMRRPFEEMQSRPTRVESFSVHPVSHLPPQIPQQVIPSGNRPAIRFNITTVPPQGQRTTIILPREPPVQQIVQSQSIPQNAVFQTAPPPSQSANHPIEPESKPLDHHRGEREEQSPTFKELAVSNAPPIQQQPQLPEPPLPPTIPEDHMDIRVAESFERSTQQAQIQLDQTPSQEQQYQHLEVQDYEVNIHEVSSQESLHEQLATLVEDYPPQGQQEMILLEEDKQPEYKIVLTIKEEPSQAESHQETSIRNLESLKDVVNPSLVDTREIKRQSAESLVLQDGASGRSLRSQKPGSISYREMRRLLLEELSG